MGRGRRNGRRRLSNPDELIGEVSRGTRTVIVCPMFRAARSASDSDARLEEARGLALAIGLTIEDAFTLPIRAPRAATLFGEGQIERIAAACAMAEADLVVVDGALTAIQQRNLEEKLKRKVIDRTGLILEIFGERAATAEGRLQVELAHLDYQAGRLVRSWTHLERQRGGFGFLGGPGETQIEADRRMIRDRMAKLRRDLEQVRRTRGLHRGRREKAPWPVIALVGYTNAGKSTLFNRLTGADVMAQDLLFATLDPTMRAIRLPGVDKAILSDTVGFISDLPTQLVAAFRATLEEVTAADVILHVRDVANPDSDEQRRHVLKVLHELELVEEDGSSPSVPVIEVWNKWDALSDDDREFLRERLTQREEDEVVCLSALTGEGCDQLLETVGRVLTAGARTYLIDLPLGEGRKLAWLHAHGEVLNCEPLAETVESGEGPAQRVSVRLSSRDYGRFITL